MSKIGKHKTRVVIEDDGPTRVKFHDTEVVRVDVIEEPTWVGETLSPGKRQVTLKSGGWETATTKKRMNQAADTFGLDYRVYQRNFTWFVDVGTICQGHYSRQTLTFTDGLEITVV